MRQTLHAAARSAALLLALLAPPAGAQTLPFSVELERVPMPAETPALQSYSHAQAGGRWLLVGGRTAGLHGFVPPAESSPQANNFPPAEANGRLWVIDPAARRVWSAPLAPGPLADPLLAGNAEFRQEGNLLYVIGGYGLDSATGRMVTFDTLSVIKTAELIEAVVAGRDLTTTLGQYVTQIRDSRLKVAGGELEKLGETFYLVLGQSFDGLYSPIPGDVGIQFRQTYTEQIRTFRLAPGAGGAPTLTNYRAYSSNASSRPYHRRDLNVAPIVGPDGRLGFGVYGGVFLPGRTRGGYRNPIYVSSEGQDPAIDSYQQYMSQYRCAVLPVYDPATGSMYTTFFGGISLYYVDRRTVEPLPDPGLPFISDVSTLVRPASGASSECVLPLQLPSLMGTEANFIIAPGPDHYANNVIRLDRLSGRTLVGHVFGGIISRCPNTGPGQCPCPGGAAACGPPTVASSELYRVYVTRGATSCLLVLR